MTNCKDTIEINDGQKTATANVSSHPSSVLNIIDFFLFFQRDKTQSDTTVPTRIFSSAYST